MLLSLASRTASSISFVLGANEGAQMHFNEKKGEIQRLNVFIYIARVCVVETFFLEGKKYYTHNYAKPCWGKKKNTGKKTQSDCEDLRLSEGSAAKIQPGKTCTWLRRGFLFSFRQNVHCASKEIWMPFRFELRIASSVQ